jgi:hypothetical protein
MHEFKRLSKLGERFGDNSSEYKTDFEYYKIRLIFIF